MRKKAISMILAAALGSALLAGCSSAQRKQLQQLKQLQRRRRKKARLRKQKQKRRKKRLLAMICCPGKQETLQRPEMEKDRR